MEEMTPEQRRRLEELRAKRARTGSSASKPAESRPIPPPFKSAPEPETPPEKERFVAFCRVCGKSLTEASMRRAQGTTFCDEHVPPESASETTSTSTLLPIPPLRKKEKRHRGKWLRNLALAAGLAATGGYVGEKLYRWGHDTEKVAQKNTKEMKRLALEKKAAAAKLAAEKEEKERIAEKIEREKRIAEEQARIQRLAEEKAEEEKKLAARETSEVRPPVPEPKTPPALRTAPKITEVKPFARDIPPESTAAPKPSTAEETKRALTQKMKEELKSFTPATPPEPTVAPKTTRTPEPAPTSGPNAAEAVRIRRELIEKMKEKDETPPIRQATVRGAYGSNKEYGTTSRAYGTNTGPGYDINPEGIRAPGEFSPGLSARDNLTLRTHPEFVQNNPFHLTEEKLIEAYRVHEKNIAHIFQSHSSGMKAWEDMKNLEARELLENKNPDPNNLLMSYIQKLHNITKVPPRGGVIRQAETAEHYIARALQWAAKIGKLSQAKLE